MNRYIFNEWLNRRNVLVIPLLWIGAALTSAQVGLTCTLFFLWCWLFMLLVRMVFGLRQIILK